MDCNHPYWLSKQLIYVPCGKCFACRIARAREWSYRLLCEIQYYPAGGGFITLTYDDDHLPSDYGLNKPTLQSYIKRIRMDANRHHNVTDTKHFSVGEYGGITSRPHYHLITLGWPLDYDYQALWPYGYVFVGNVTPESIRYVTGYLTKKYMDESALAGRPAPFQIQSQGLGLRYVIDNDLRLATDGYDIYNGHKIALPEYYKSYNPLIHELSLEEKQANAIATLNKLCRPKIPLSAVDTDFTAEQIRARNVLMPLRELTIKKKFELSRKDKL